ncbi:12996_t:CDS:2 [Funneliformis geosporum]|uniref:16409_t:CDS:1 n=1 Tax=Funneliformis geosporum TaxID=1117311 RepID=A0A9W4SBJ1_9GLOM|nr:16409_t:CDS:2 [Funneliformis geosporum]CAI2182151.1 12996_t:CDS:2 [Funneliformis geosporum]
MQNIVSETNKSSDKNLTTTTFSTPQVNKALNMVTPSTGSTIDESDTEEVVVEGVAAGVSANPLNIPSSYTLTLNPTVSGVKNGGYLSGASSDSADSEAKRLRKKSLPYYESVGRSFRILAEERGWKNPDNSIFPISVANLCNYVRVKKDTNNSKSVDWYIAALKKYQELVLNVKDWDEVRKHPEVKRLMSQIKVEGNSKIVGDSSPVTPSGKDKGKGNGEQSIIEINKNNSEFPHSNKVNPQFGSHSNLSLQTFSSTNKFPGPAETALALLGPFMVDDDSIGRKDPILSKKLVDETLDFDTPNYEPSTSKFTSRLVDPMVISASDDDEDYLPPIKKSSRGYIPDRKRRRKRHLDSESHSDDDEPESFKSRFENALGVLKSKYVDACKNHPNGCCTVKTGKHFVLNDRLLRRWASLCASGDDVNEDSLPYSDELERDFSELKAILI